MRYGSDDGKWCKIEIMGHREHIGRALEVPLLDGKAFRVCDETEPGPMFYGIGAVFSLRWLTDKEGEEESAKRVAEWEEQGKRHAHYAVIGAIQDTIRRVIEGVKMSPRTLESIARQSHPAMTAEDFATALDGMCLAEVEVDGVKMLWNDPDEIAF